LLYVSTYSHIFHQVKAVGIKADHLEFCKLIAYVWPAMQKMKVRDLKYAAARAHAFSTEIGRAYYREMSIDELPGLTTPETLATILALCEYMEMPANYVAPAFGWQKNFPFADNVELEKRISAAWEVCKGFGTSIGFHSGSGKSAENYELCGKITGSKLEIKTSGRYTYALGVAVSKSKDKGDQALWKEWYAWTVDVATNSAFTSGAEQKMARSFISQVGKAPPRHVHSYVPALCTVMYHALTPTPSTPSPSRPIVLPSRRISSSRRSHARKRSTPSSLPPPITCSTLSTISSSFSLVSARLFALHALPTYTLTHSVLSLSRGLPREVGHGQPEGRRV
jgi:hypothetical protein